MRDPRHASTPAAAPEPGPTTGKTGSGAPTGTGRSPDAPESLFAVLRERIERLETDVRQLQSQSANRA